MSRSVSQWAVLAALTLIAACSRARDPVLPPSAPTHVEGAPRASAEPPPPSPQDGTSPSEAEARAIRAHCPSGVPLDRRPRERGAVRFVVRDGYALEHSSRDKVPLWVCEHLARHDVRGKRARRKEHFAPDPLLPPGERAELADYRRSGFDRGHLAAAADHAGDQHKMDETFFLSNMAPQVAELNRGLWRELEEKARAWIDARGEGHIVTGPVFADGTPRTRIGPGQVAVPTHFFKIVVAPGPSGRQEAIAFIVENRPYPPPYAIFRHVRAVDDIESASGFDFMPELSADEEERLERHPSPPW